MKVVILAGGRGSRISEETAEKPKPMIDIGGHPMLWHIMKHYARYNFRDFIVALGYKGEAVKRYFADYQLMTADMTVDLAAATIDWHRAQRDDWSVRLIDTGLHTLTGSRVKRLSKFLMDDTFMVTYGDGVANVALDELLAFHRSHGLLATVTAVHPPARFGSIVFDGDKVASFSEKPQASEGWINGGFLVLESAVLDYLRHDGDSLEASLIERLAADGQVAAFRHHGFWQCCDTLRDLHLLQELWESGAPPWRTWK